MQLKTNLLRSTMRPEGYLYPIQQMESPSTAPLKTRRSGTTVIHEITLYMMKSASAGLCMYGQEPLLGKGSNMLIDGALRSLKVMIY